MSSPSPERSSKHRVSRSRSYSRSRSRSFSYSRSRSNSYDHSRSPYPSRSRTNSQNSRSDSNTSNEKYQPKEEIWNNKIFIVGEKVRNINFHFCFDCELPILTYGRMIPCKHVLCLKCANNSPKNCFICNKAVTKIDECVVGNIFMCNETDNCQRTYISQEDLNAHINHRHVPKSSYSGSVPPKEAANDKKKLNNNSFTTSPIKMTAPNTSESIKSNNNSINSDLYSKMNDSSKIPTYSQINLNHMSPIKLTQMNQPTQMVISPKLNSIHQLTNRSNGNNIQQICTYPGNANFGIKQSPTSFTKSRNFNQPPPVS